MSKQKELSVVGNLIFLRKTEYALLKMFYKNIKLHIKREMRMRDFENMGDHISDVYNAAHVLESMGFIDLYKKNNVVYAKYNATLITQAMLSLGESIDFGFTPGERSQMAIAAKCLMTADGVVESRQYPEITNPGVRFHIKLAKVPVVNCFHSQEARGYSFMATATGRKIAARWLEFTRIMRSGVLNKGKYQEMQTASTTNKNTVQQAFIASAGSSMH